MEQVRSAKGEEGGTVGCGVGCGTVGWSELWDCGVKWVVGLWGEVGCGTVG